MLCFINAGAVKSVKSVTKDGKPQFVQTTIAGKTPHKKVFSLCYVVYLVERLATHISICVDESRNSFFF